MDIFVTLLNTQEETSLLNAQEETTRIQRRIIKDRQNPMEEWSGEEFRVRYRFSKGNVVDLLNIISGDLRQQETIQSLLCFDCWLRCDFMQPASFKEATGICSNSIKPQCRGL